jgi:DNA sulfur modification protein DndB
MPDWIAVIEGRLSAKQAREGKLHSQAIVLEALGRLGCYLLTRHPKDWEQKLPVLPDVDWQRSASHWENRVIFGRVIKKDRTALIGIVAYLKQTLGLPLNSEEEQIEQAIGSH